MITSKWGNSSENGMTYLAPWYFHRFSGVQRLHILAPSYVKRHSSTLIPLLSQACNQSKDKRSYQKDNLHGQDVKKGVESKCSWPPGHCQCNINAWFTTPEETSHVSTIIGTGIVFVNWSANASLGKWIPSLFFYASVRKHSWSTFMHAFRYNASIIRISTMLITIKSHSDRLRAA